MIREANHRDAIRISEIVSGCYRNYEITDNYSHASVEKVIEKRGSEESINSLIENESVFIFSRNEDIVGVISLKQNEITKLYVEFDFQKQGVGTLLFRHAESIIRENGFTTLMLGVAAPTAVAFYEKMGMHISETRESNCGPSKGRQATIMKKSLV